MISRLKKDSLFESKLGRKCLVCKKCGHSITMHHTSNGRVWCSCLECLNHCE